MNISKAIFPSGEHALYPCMYVKNKLLTKKTNWKKIDNSQEEDEVSQGVRGRSIVKEKR